MIFASARSTTTCFCCLFDFLEVEDDGTAIHVDVPLEHRRDTERPVLARIALAADAKEALADEAYHGGGDAVAREHVAVRDLAVERLANAREVAGEMAHAIILALLAYCDRPFVIAILLAPLHVEAPRLDRGARHGGDVHVAPCRRKHQGVDALELLPVGDRAPLRILISEARALAPVPRNPLCAHTLQRESKKQSDGIAFGT